MNGLRSTIRQDMRDIHFRVSDVVVLDKRGVSAKGILCGQVWDLQNYRTLSCSVSMK